MAQASAEKLEQTEPAEKERSGLSATERAVGKYARTAFSKRKKNRSVCPEYQITRGGESQSGREPELDEKEEDQSESMKRKKWTPQ